jgi:SAM-dependent methyltransferase
MREGMAGASAEEDEAGCGRGIDARSGWTRRPTPGGSRGLAAGLLRGKRPRGRVDDPFQGGTAFRALGDHARENYLRFPYTTGTRQEASFLVEALGLPRGARVLDVACGLGRHEPHLPWRVVGADLSRGLLETARSKAKGDWVQAEARALPFRPRFQGAFSVCEGAFGLLPDDAAHVAMLRSVRACLAPGAPFLLSAMSVFAMCHDESFDPATNVMRDEYDVDDPQGRVRRFRLATRAFAPREVVAMGEAAGFRQEALWGGVTGAYEKRPFDVDDAEMLVLFRNPLG